MNKPKLVAVQAGPVWIAYHYSNGKATVVRWDGLLCAPYDLASVALDLLLVKGGNHRHVSPGMHDPNTSATTTY